MKTKPMVALVLTIRIDISLRSLSCFLSNRLLTISLSLCVCDHWQEEEATTLRFSLFVCLFVLYFNLDKSDSHLFVVFFLFVIVRRRRRRVQRDATAWNFSCLFLGHI